VSTRHNRSGGKHQQTPYKYPAYFPSNHDYLTPVIANSFFQPGQLAATNNRRYSKNPEPKHHKTK
jgi:hypothetical protein